MLVLVVLISAIYSYQSYVMQRKLLMKGIDEKLYVSAKMAQAILPLDYHDRIVDSTSVSKKEYDQIVDQYNKLCVDLDIEYLWSLMKVNGKIVFTSSTSPDKNVNNQKQAKFFEIHTNPDAYKQAFTTQEPQYQIIIDKWGKLKSVLIPFRDRHGRPYLFGACAELSEIDQLLNQSIEDSAFLALGFLIIGSIFSYMFANLLSKPFSNLTNETTEIASARLDGIIEEKGSYEQVMLARSFNRMSLVIKERIAELKKSEENLYTTLNSIGDAVISTDTEGAITHMNPVAENLTGWMLAEAQGKPLTEVFNIINAKSREPAVNPVKKVLESSEIVGLANHTSLIRKDGTEYQIADSAAPIRGVDNAINGVILVFRDVTGDYRLQEQLKEINEKYQRLVSNLIGTFLYRLNVNGVFEYVSPSITKVLGYTQEEFCKHFSTYLTDNPINQKSLEFSALSLRGIQQPRYELEIFAKGNDIHWLEVSESAVRDENGEIVAVEGVAHDITERKRSEEELRKSQDKLMTIIDQAPVMIDSFDESGKCLIWNAECVKRLGWTAEEVNAADNPMALFYPDPEIQKQVYMALELADGSFREYTLQTKEGSTVEQVWADFRLPDGAIIGLGYDITERNQAERESVKLQSQLAQAQKMESIGRLAGGVAHDFNNMLSVILGYAEMAQKRVDSSQPLHADLQQIVKAAERSADLTRQLLAFARKQTVLPKVMNLNDAVEVILKMLRRLIGEDITLAWMPGSELWSIKMDTSQVDQILTNLCVNARDAITEVGKITIETDNCFFDETYCAGHAGFVVGEYVLLAVSDNGCGMDKETLAQIFEPFFSTKNIGEGTGLGLSTVYGIVKQNHGFVYVYSEPHQGTTFKIYLPRYRDKAGTLPTERTTELDLSGGETILLVEDEPSLLMLSTKMLEELGYRILAVGSSSEAIELAEKHAGEIHLLLTDVIMPEMNGWDLAQNILSLHPDMKVFFMSGYPANVIAHHGVLEEGVNFIHKPFSIQDMATKIREVLDND